MEIDVVKIGNSRGIRIPQSILKQCKITDKVEMRVEGSRIVLEHPRCREGWAEAFASLGAEQPQLLPEHSLSSFDDEEWDW